MSLLSVHEETQAGPIVWTVPKNQTWQLLFGHVIFTSSATGGNRWLTFTVEDETGHIMWDAHAGIKQGSSQVREYRFNEGGSIRETSFIDDDLLVPLPNRALLLEGWTMTLKDSENIDVVNDTFVAHGLMHIINSNNPRPDQLL